MIRSIPPGGSLLLGIPRGIRNKSRLNIERGERAEIVDDSLEQLVFFYLESRIKHRKRGLLLVAAEMSQRF